jgi:hypothetical protein
MSYVQYARPKAPASPCGALNAHVRGMGQDATATSDAATGISIPNPLSAFSNLFSSTDFSTWGIGEWVVIAAVGFLGLKLVQGVFSTGKSVKRAVRKRRRRSQQRQSLMSQLESI